MINLKQDNMSDYSAAYHRKTTNTQQVKDILQRANMSGCFFQPSNGWTTFMTEEETFVAEESIIQANQEVLLFFYRTNDRLLWGFSIYQGPKLVGSYAIFENDEEELEIENTTTPDALALIVDSENLTELVRVLNPSDNEAAYEKWDYAFAELVGLEHIEWVSFAEDDDSLEVYEVEN